MSTETTFINTLKLHKSSCDIAIIQSEWEATRIKINLVLAINGSSSSAPMGFTGEIRIELLEEIAMRFDIPFETFINDTKLALITQNGLPDFQYECDTKKFTVWRTVAGGGLRRCYGTTILEANDSLCFELLRNSLNMIATLRASEQNIGCELKKYKEAHSQLKTVFDAQNEEKKRRDKTFAELLNKKKQRISKLEDPNFNMEMVQKRTMKRSSTNEFLDINDNKEIFKPEPDTVRMVLDISRPSTSFAGQLPRKKKNQTAVTGFASIKIKTDKLTQDTSPQSIQLPQLTLDPAPPSTSPTPQLPLDSAPSRTKTHIQRFPSPTTQLLTEDDSFEQFMARIQADLATPSVYDRDTEELPNRME